METFGPACLTGGWSRFIGAWLQRHQECCSLLVTASPQTDRGHLQLEHSRGRLDLQPSRLAGAVPSDVITQSGKRALTNVRKETTLIMSKLYKTVLKYP